MSPSFGKPQPLAALNDLVIGHTITPVAGGGRGTPLVKGSGWNLPPGVYTPRQVVEGCAPLLETVLYNLGPDPPKTVPARKMLLDNLASNLRVDTRESTLQLSDSITDAGRKEMAGQARRIGKTLVQYAHEITKPEFDPKLKIRSSCEGHLLNHAVAGLMFGPRSQMHLMELFNEYLHQMVLLRDALLPFQNYADVLIPIEGKIGRQLGMRGMEQARSQFLTELMTRSISQKSVFKVAKELLAPKLASTGGYGFQYSHGLILPAFVAGDSSLRLLHYTSARLDDSTPEVLFDYEYEDYYSAPRLEISPSASTLEANQWPIAAPTEPSSKVLGCSLAIEKLADGKGPPRHLVKLIIDFEKGGSTSVDLGQISRGRRYAYRVEDTAGGAVNGATNGSSPHAAGFSKPSEVHTAASILTQSGPGLVSSEKGGIHVISTDNPVVGLALLGKIYPENIIMVSAGQSPQEAESLGKSFANSPRFVIYGEDWKVMPHRG